MGTRQELKDKPQHSLSFSIKDFFLLSPVLIRSYLCFYSRRWRKNNFLRKSPDDTKKEDNDDVGEER